MGYAKGKRSVRRKIEMVNKKVGKRIATMKSDLDKIMQMADRAKKMLSEVSDDDDLYVVEREVEELIRKAQGTYNYIIGTYDYFEEE